VFTKISKVLKLRVRACLILLIFIITNVHAAAVENSHVIFDKIFHDWTDGFNQKDIVVSCGLFSKNVVANYQGTPQKNYETICNGFKEIFGEKNRDYHYRYQLKNVYYTDNLAAARITWYLTIYEYGKVISEVQDEGIDILEKNNAGKWQIINYIAFPEK